MWFSIMNSFFLCSFLMRTHEVYMCVDACFRLRFNCTPAHVHLYFTFWFKQTNYLFFNFIYSFSIIKILIHGSYFLKLSILFFIFTLPSIVKVLIVSTIQNTTNTHTRIIICKIQWKICYLNQFWQTPLAPKCISIWRD